MKRGLLALLLLASPGLASTTRHVGPGQTYATLHDAVVDANAADTGDSIIVHPGTYLNDHATLAVSNVTILGLDPRPVFDAELDSTHVEDQKGILVLASTALNTTIDHLEFTRAISTTQNGSGVRIDPQTGWVAIRNCSFHDNQMHIEGCPDSLLVENCELNGTLPTYTNGNQHCVYANQNSCRVFVFRANYSHRAHNGHQVKSRAQNTFILYNRLASEDAASAYDIDIPDCGQAYVIGNVIVHGVNAANERLIRYGAESGDNPGRELYVVNNTLVNREPIGIFVDTDLAPGGTTITSRNNVFYGAGTLYSGSSTIVESNNYIDGTLDNAPGFLNPAGDDYHLTAASPGGIVDGGADPGTSSDGFALLPTRQYVYDASSEARPAAGALDVGAFEYPSPTAVALSLVSTAADPTRVRMEWHAAGDVRSALVYRRTTDSEWTLLGPARLGSLGDITFEDRGVDPGGFYGYRLVVQEAGGQTTSLEQWVSVPVAGAPAALRLLAPSPNPSGGQGVLRYGVPRTERVRLSIFDPQGRRMRTLLDGVQSGGWRSISWDGRDQGGRLVSSGVYLARLEAGPEARTVKVLFVR